MHTIAQPVNTTRVRLATNIDRAVDRAVEIAAATEGIDKREYVERALRLALGMAAGVTSATAEFSG